MPWHCSRLALLAAGRGVLDAVPARLAPQPETAVAAVAGTRPDGGAASAWVAPRLRRRRPAGELRPGGLGVTALLVPQLRHRAHPVLRSAS